MALKQAKVKLITIDLRSLVDSLIDINRINGHISDASLVYRTASGQEVRFGLEFDEDSGQHALTVVSLVPFEE